MEVQYFEHLWENAKESFKISLWSGKFNNRFIGVVVINSQVYNAVWRRLLKLIKHPMDRFSKNSEQLSNL